MVDLYKGFAPCKQCNYTAPPELKREERKHFDPHAYQCTRCHWQPETMPNKEMALEAYNARTPLPSALRKGVTHD